jgi:sulfatase modifying factor 1
VRLLAVVVVIGCGRIDFDPQGGAGGTHDSPLVPGGTFFRNYDVAADGMFPVMTHPATVSAFRLDRYEVTVGQFRAFLDGGFGTQGHPPTAGAGAHARIPGSGWNASWNASLAADRTALEAILAACSGGYETWPMGDDAKPINCVSWYDAMAFCVADGGYLPTAAEWDFAAAGGDEQRAYPWSQPPGALVIDPTYANYGCSSQGEPATCPIADVGSAPAGDGAWGQSDLGGSMFEYVLDTNTGIYIDPCDDCADLTDTTSRSFRGGSFGQPAATLRTSHIEGGTQPAHGSKVGFRCARAP